MPPANPKPATRKLLCDRICAKLGTDFRARRPGAIGPDGKNRIGRSPRGLVRDPLPHAIQTRGRLMDVVPIRDVKKRL
jgi:hypothetical protein